MSVDCWRVSGGAGMGDEERRVGREAVEEVGVRIGLGSEVDESV